MLHEKIPADDASIVSDLVDNQIIEDQIAQFPGLDVKDSDVAAEMNAISDMHGLQPDTVRNAIRRRLRTSEFIDLRFRQFLSASDEDLRQYYDNTFVPEARRRGLNPIPPLEEIAGDIRNNIIQEKVTHDVDNWLVSTRRRTDIEIFK